MTSRLPTPTSIASRRTPPSSTPAAHPELLAVIRRESTGKTLVVVKRGGPVHVSEVIPEVLETVLGRVHDSPSLDTERPGDAPCGGNASLDPSLFTLKGL